MRLKTYKNENNNIIEPHQSFTGSYTKKCTRILGKVTSCILLIISIDYAGPFDFEYLGLGKKEEGQVILSFHHAQMILITLLSSSFYDNKICSFFLLLNLNNVYASWCFMISFLKLVSAIFLSNFNFFTKL